MILSAYYCLTCIFSQCYFWEFGVQILMIFFLFFNVTNLLSIVLTLTVNIWKSYMWTADDEMNMKAILNEDYLRSKKKRFKSRTGLNFCFRHYFNFATAVVLITGKIAFIFCSAIVRRISLLISLRTVKWSDFVHYEELRSAKCDSLWDQKKKGPIIIHIAWEGGGGGMGRRILEDHWVSGGTEGESVVVHRV